MGKNESGESPKRKGNIMFIIFEGGKPPFLRGGGKGNKW